MWVRETGEGKGEHVHILWHGPADLPYLRRWLNEALKACGARRVRGVCFTESIGRTLRHAETGGDDYRANMDWTLDYLLKGADPAARAKLGIEHSEPGGGLVGKRCGVSQNIGPKARA